MKKFISMISAAAILSSAAAMPVYAEGALTDIMREKASQADFNDDGRVTLEDAGIALKYVAESGASGKEDPELEKLYDINGNGDASVVDVSCLFQYITEITLPGDVNEDGRVNSADASYLLKYIASYDESSVKGSVMESRCFNFGDINGDGKMTPADASLILAYSAELASDETLTLADFLAARNS